MNILTIDNGSKYLNSLLDLLKKTKATVDLSTRASLAKSGMYDLVIISGGGHHRPIAHNSKYYEKKIEFIRNYKCPLLGICLGFELIAYTFGAHLAKIKKREGIVEIEKNPGQSNFWRQRKIFGLRKSPMGNTRASLFSHWLSPIERWI